uniref:DUF4614 domain-containing protein n=1 Tax=Strigamia maritima TaxID=126957 RepID=T1JHV7_STRMM
MGDRLRKLLDRATAQVKRSGNVKTVKFSEEKEIYFDKIDESEILNELPVEKISFKGNEIDKKIKQTTDNENDEIKAYLSQLSRKTRPEVVENENKDKNIQSDISDLSSLIIEQEIGRKGVSKYTSDRDNNSNLPVTALERVSHFEKKYLKSQPQKSRLLDTESDISFTDSFKNKNTLKDDESNAKNAPDLIDEIDENKSINDDISSILLEDLHFVDELPEFTPETEKPVEKSVLIDDTEEVESKISIIQTLSDAIKTITTSSTQSQLETDNQIETEDEISENLLQNVHLDLSEQQTSSETPTPQQSSPKTRKIDLKPEIRPLKPAKSSKSIAIQTNLDLIPRFTVEIEPYTPPLTLTNVLVSQGTLDAFTVTNPAMLALNAMMKEQMNFARTLFASRYNVYTQQMSSLQPDYHYTTWNDVIKDVARCRKGRMKKFG